MQNYWTCESLLHSLPHYSQQNCELYGMSNRRTISKLPILELNFGFLNWKNLKNVEFPILKITRIYSFEKRIFNIENFKNFQL